MTSNIRIICFDINSGYDEDFNKSLGENILALENPLRILNEFLEIHLFLESEKIRKSSSEIKYTFKFNFSEKNEIIFEIIVLNDLSFIHDISLDADAYLVFTNLENENTIIQLEKIIKYILESCSLEIKTYLVGIYKDKILSSLNKEILESYFEEEKLNCEYYQIKYRNNKNENENNYNHLCIYECKYKIINKSERRYSQKEKEKERKNSINKKNELKNLIDVVENILIQIYEMKNNVIFETKINKKIDKERSDSDSGISRGNCIVI